MRRNNNYNIAIFGAGGFIGSHLVKNLLLNRERFHVTCLDVTDEKLKKLIPSKKINFLYCDIKENDSLSKEIVQKSDIVIDLVAYANPAIYLDKPIEVVELNLFNNLKLVDYCIQYKKRLIQFSTCEVYGKSGGNLNPFKEDETDLILGPICNHRWIYSCAKQLLERMIHARGIRGELEYTVIRPFNFIGPEMDYLVYSKNDGTPRVFPHFMSSLLYNHPIYVVDHGNNRRTFTYIDDAINAIIIILKNLDKTRNQIINIGSPENDISIKELGHKMKEIYASITGTKSEVPIIDISANEFYGAGYEDCDLRIPDISKLKKLSWEPKYNLDDTLKKSMEYYLNPVINKICDK